MKTSKENIYRRLAKKAYRRSQSTIQFWMNFNRILDVEIYNASYKTAFDPTNENISERNILFELKTIAVIQMGRK